MSKIDQATGIVIASEREAQVQAKALPLLGGDTQESVDKTKDRTGQANGNSETQKQTLDSG